MASPRSSSTLDPFRFGWRLRPGTGERIPLTPDDVLHPQEGDEISETTLQERDLFYLLGAFRWTVRNRPDVLVLSDCLVDWGVPGLRNHSPDLCVFENVRDRERNWSMFRVVQEGARPVLALEIVSVDPELRPNDLDIKVREYHRAGVPFYYIIDQQETDGPRQLLGYRRGRRRNLLLRLDARGRLALEPLGLWLGLVENRAICFDAKGVALPDSIQAQEARERAEQERQHAEQERAAEARARQQAEQERAAEVLARQQAERERERAQQERAAEARARQQAEQERAAETLARQQAETDRAAEAQARQQAEAALAEAQARLRELETQQPRPPRRRKPRSN